MAHYITADGRVQSFEAEVKSDGTVCPKNYHEFDNDDTSGENPQHSAEPLIVKYEKKRNKNQIGINKSGLTELSKNITSYIEGINLSQQGKGYLKTMFLPCNTVHPSAKAIKRLQATWSLSELMIIEQAINYLNILVAKQVIGHDYIPAKVHLNKIRSNDQNLQNIKTEVKNYIENVKITELGKNYLKSLFMPCKIVNLTDKAITKIQAIWTDQEIPILETAINELNDLLIKYFPDSQKPNKISLTKNLPILDKTNIKTTKKTLSNQSINDNKHSQKSKLEQTTDLKPSRPQNVKPKNKVKLNLEIKLRLNKHCLEVLRLCNHTKEQLNKAIDKLISIPGFSRKANSLLLDLVHKRDLVDINQKLQSKIKNKGLLSEEEKIIYTIKVYNNLINNYKLTTNKKQIRSKDVKCPKNSTKLKTVQPTLSEQNHKSGKTTTDSNLDGKPAVNKEWVSGNFVRRGPQPKYGYARDRFGRVQERDSYREDRDVNPYSSYSSYDSEDDHDSQNILD